jgi:hypothetical protein
VANDRVGLVLVDDPAPEQLPGFEVMLSTCRLSPSSAIAKYSRSAIQMSRMLIVSLDAICASG